jgi:hypothetical protein
MRTNELTLSTRDHVKEKTPCTRFRVRRFLLEVPDQGTSGQGVLGATHENARQMPSGGGAPHIMHFFLPLGQSVGGAGSLHCQPQVLVSRSHDFVGRVPKPQRIGFGPSSASVQSASLAQLVTGGTHAPVLSAELPFFLPSHALR